MSRDCVRTPDLVAPVSRDSRVPVVGHNLEHYSQYVDSIYDLAHTREPVALAAWRKKLAVSLDGEPRRVLRQQVPQTELRRQGAYFTAPRLANRLVNAAKACPVVPPSYYDPACGGGDLLLAVARKLPLQSTFSDTLSTWSIHLAGCDISPDFVRLTKARLTLLAAKRSKVHPPFDLPVVSRAFPNIEVADSLAPNQCIPSADVILMNPPFGYTFAPNNCVWSTGRVNLAALFVDRVIRNISDGTQIAAILPDVLRSGSRYAGWREWILASGCVIRETPVGLFDRWTDVDVYLFHFRKEICPNESAEFQRTEKPTYGVGKRFIVHVGSVVPHRHAETGPLVRYIHARSLPPWSECPKIMETRRFSGRLFDPPFVTVRRTSRPDSGRRALATLVCGNDPVAVENHLIVLLPKDNSVQTCRKLMRRLRFRKTDDWLNARIRCRHLTTRALAEMPWWYKP